MDGALAQAADEPDEALELDETLELVASFVLDDEPPSPAGLVDGVDDEPLLAPEPSPLLLAGFELDDEARESLR